MDRRYQPHQKIAVTTSVILIIAVLSFGAVEIWASTLIGVSVFTCFLLWITGAGRDIPGGTKISREETYMLIALFSLVAYVLIQMIPIPPYILKHVSPRSFELYSYFTVDPNPAMYISLYPYRTEGELFRILAYTLFFVMLVFQVKDEHTLLRMFTIMSYFGFGLAVFAILQKAAWNGKIYWFREITAGTPFGPFVNRNHYAGFIGMLLPLTLGLSFLQKRKERRLLFGFFAVIMAVSIFLTLSRAGIISFFAGITLFALFLSWYKFRTRRIWVLAAFLFIVFLYLLYLGIDPVIDRFYATDITREARLAVWSDTLSACKDFFLAGSGLGTFINVFQLYSSEKFMTIYDHAHNDYLEFFLEMGIIGTLLLFSFLFLYIRLIVRGKWDERTGIVRISLFSSLITVLVHSIFDFNLHIPSNALMFSFVLGVLLAGSKMAGEKT